MRVMNHNCSARKQRLHPHSALWEDNIQQCVPSFESRHKDTNQYL